MWQRPALTEADLSLYDALLRLTRGFGAMRLALADGLERLDAMNGIQRLGYPGLDSYGRERLGRTGRWLGDLRALNRRLEALPLLRAAYVSGLISTSKVERLARHLRQTGATDELSQRKALALGADCDVRKLREVLGATEPPDIGPTATTRLTRTVSRLDAAIFEGAIKLLNALGATTRKDAIEAMLAEAMTTLLDLTAKHSEVRADLLARWASPSWLDPEPGRMSGGSAVDPFGDFEDLDPEDLPTAPTASPRLGRLDDTSTTVEEVDAALRGLAAELCRRDVRLGELAMLAEQTGLAFKLGCPDPDTLYRDRLGVAPSSMGARIALARRLPCLAGVEGAIFRGQLGFEAASLVARVATPQTEVEWLALAERSTVKQLREAVEAAELHARLDGAPLDRLAVPTPSQLEDARTFESAALSIGFESAPEEPNRMSVDDTSEPDLGTVPLRLTLPEDLAALWRDLECLLREVDPEADLLSFLAVTTLRTWRGTAPKVAYHDIYLRDRYRCQHPACRSRNVTPHHIVFRSHRGDDSPENLVSLCERCHLDLVHGGHLGVTGRAPNGLRWVAQGFEVGTA